MKTISIGCDHGGVELKNAIINALKEKYNFIDNGTNSLESVDYPDYAKLICEKVIEGKADFGVAICKSGIGMSIACNKMKNIRCALVSNIQNAKLSRKHNNANVIALGSNDVDFDLAIKIIEAYDSEEFEKRHQTRIDKISELENK